VPSEYSAILLSIDGDSSRRQCGVGMLAVRAPKRPPGAGLEPFTKRLARTLYEFGDVSTMQQVDPGSVDPLDAGRAGRPAGSLGHRSHAKSSS
jgi:hypothetical protein